MPLALWLLLGSVAAYLVFKSGQTAASTAAMLPSSTTPGPVSASGTVNLSVSGPQEAGGRIGPFLVPVESTLPEALQTEFASFFAHADQSSFTDQTVLDFSNQLAGEGYSIAAGSAQSVWQMILAAMNSQPVAQASSSACPPGTHAPTLAERIAGLGQTGCVPNASSSASPEVFRTAQGYTYSKTFIPPVQK